MNKFYSILVAFVVTLFASSAFAFNPPASPAPASWISDPGHVLSDDAHARLDTKLRQINQSSANEIAALIVPTLDGENIADVGDLTFKSWGVGKKNLDNGVLVVLAMKEHKSRISTGKGVEGDLPDLKSADILSGARPYLRSGNVEGALGYIFDSSASAIANHKAEAAAAAARGASAPQASNNSTSSCDVSAAGSGSNWPWGLALLALGLLGWYLAHSSARRRAQTEELERQAREARARQRQLNAERETARRAEEVRLNKPAPPIVHPAPVTRPVAQVAQVAPPPSPVAAGVTAAAGVVLALQEEENRRHQAEAARKRREAEEESARRRRRQQEEDDDRRRRSSESSSSSSSSSSSFDWGGGSSGGSSGGFGGGDSGGGGASGDW